MWWNKKIGFGVKSATWHVPYTLYTIRLFTQKPLTFRFNTFIVQIAEIPGNDNNLFQYIIEDFSQFQCNIIKCCAKAKTILS